MGCFNKEIKLEKRKRGTYLITKEIISKVPEIKKYKNAQINIFIKHTSASLTINENADISVRKDLEYYLNKIVPEEDPKYTHTNEGPDDMPAHIKTILTNTSIHIPVINRKMALGRWQGIYFLEHRNRGGERKLVISITY